MKAHTLVESDGEAAVRGSFVLKIAADTVDSESENDG